MIPKQDRVQARTPAQLEQEYNFDRLKNASNSSSQLGIQIQNLNQTLAQFMASTVNKLNELDGNAQTWFSKGVPTLTNYPAVEWGDKKEKHIGDIYYNEDDGRMYLFKGVNGVYEWVACQGTSETTTETYNVVFYSEDNVVIAGYIINKGDAINPPVADVGWKDSEGVVVTFPYTPTSDTNLTLFIQTTRSEVELNNKGDLVYSWYQSSSKNGTVTKTNDGWSIVGCCNDTTNGLTYFAIVGKDEASVINNSTTTATSGSGTVAYNGETYYYRTKGQITSQITDYGKCVQLEETYTDNTTLATKLLDYYYMVD